MDETREVSLRLSVGDTVTQDQLFALLRQCEHEVRRYEWTSGYILIRLWESPETPKKAAEFAEWVETHTGLALTQNEITRRISVYRFYSRLGDVEIIGLVERVGVKVAHRASRVITEQNAREVLTACLDSEHVTDTLAKFETAKPHREKRSSDGPDESGARSVEPVMRTQVEWLRFSARVLDRAGHPSAAHACRDAAETLQGMGFDQLVKA